MKQSTMVATGATALVDGDEGASGEPVGAGRLDAIRSEREPWQTALIIRFVIADVVAVVLAIVFAWMIRRPYVNENLVAFGIEFSYAVVGMVAVPLWIVGLVLGGAYDRTIIGSSPVAYTRVLRVLTTLFGLVCALAFIGQVPMSRFVVALFFPATGVFDIALRRVVRSHLHHRRAKGLDLHRLVLVGQADAVANLTTHLRRATHAGYEVVAAYVPDSGDGVTEVDLDVDVLGTPDDLLDDLDHLDIDAIAISGSGLFEQASIRSLSWKLHGTGVRLLMAPDVAEIAGPRIVSRPAAGLPMLLVEEPRTRGLTQTFKGLLERGIAAVAVAVLSPVLAVIAVLVKVTSPGPVLFRQQRIARDGRPFDMLKFRSMVADAEDLLDDLRDENDHDGVLFKMREDPRVTRVGRFLRRYSLDELPQLFNVVAGDMAIVGPRPPLPEEVARYEGDTGRRLMVKPGITGLWQVSGRSDLSWDETVRLDLYYVENWSLALDLIIVAKTARAVVEGHGAY